MTERFDELLKGCSDASDYALGIQRVMDDLLDYRGGIMMTPAKLEECMRLSKQAMEFANRISIMMMTFRKVVRAELIQAQDPIKTQSLIQSQIDEIKEVFG